MARTDSTNPIVVAKRPYDPLQFYRSPLFRTMAGYKFLSVSFLLCGTVAVPGLLYTGQQAGYIGSLAVALASMGPMALQTLFVPNLVSRISLLPAPQGSSTKKGGRGHSTAPMDVLDRLLPQDMIRVERFGLFGQLRTRTETIADIKAHKGFQWTNWKTKDGTGYYVDMNAAGPILRKINRMIEKPDEPATWRTY